MNTTTKQKQIRFREGRTRVIKFKLLSCESPRHVIIKPAHTKQNKYSRGENHHTLLSFSPYDKYNKALQ